MADRCVPPPPLSPCVSLSSLAPADRWLPWPFWGLSTLAASVMDQPIRGLSRGLLLSRTAAVESSPESYDRKRAAELWTAAAVVAGLPEELMK